MHGYQKDLTKMCMHYNNVKNNPLFQSLSDVTTVLKLSPPPSLHLMLGIFKHIWKSMDAKSEENKRILHEFAIRNNCTCESYWSKTFEGNECSKLIRKLTTEDQAEEVFNLSDIHLHLDAIKKFNEVKTKFFEIA